MPDGAGIGVLRFGESIGSHHVVEVDEGVVDGNNLAVSLGLVEVGSAGNKTTDTAETVDTDRDGPGEREEVRIDTCVAQVASTTRSDILSKPNVSTFPPTRRTAIGLVHVLKRPVRAFENDCPVLCASEGPLRAKTTAVEERRGCVLPISSRDVAPMVSHGKLDGRAEGIRAKHVPPRTLVRCGEACSCAPVPTMAKRKAQFLVRKRNCNPMFSQANRLADSLRSDWHAAGA